MDYALELCYTPAAHLVITGKSRPMQRFCTGFLAALLSVFWFPAFATAQVVVGPGSGTNAPVQLIESTGTQTAQMFPPGFLGGANVTLGDVNGDGMVDIIAGAGPGGGPHVRVLSGADLSELASFYAYDPSFAGGVHVGSGDVNGDGRADIIVGAGAGGGPHVRVFSGVDLSELASFFAYNPAFTGGVFVAAGDVDGDGLADIVTGAGITGGPHVRVFSGADLRELASFFAYDANFPGGVSVAAGDVNGDGLSDIITGAGPGGGPHVRVFSGADLTELASFYGVDSSFVGGVNVAAGDYDGDGRVDLIIGEGAGGMPHVVVVSGLDFTELDNFFVPGMTGSITIGSVGDAAGLRFTSPVTTTFTAGSAGTFTITTVGNPAPEIAQSGTLPDGVTFTDNGDGTATLAGTPGASTGGSYILTFTADNGTGTAATQTFTLSVHQVPGFTSAAATTFTTGAPGTFPVTTTGFPRPTITRAGATLPAGVTWVDNGDGTGTLSGTADPGTGGTYAITFTADNGVNPPATQSFTLTVSGTPTFTSPTTTTFTVGSIGSFTITTVGTPTPTITAGALPAGVTFVANADGTGTLSGTPAAGTGGAHTLTFTAANGVPPDATQTFTLNINEAPAITSEATATFTIGTPGSFPVTTSGFPAPAIALGGVALPSGLNFTDNGDGTATLDGTPAAGTGGTYAVTLTPSNAAGTGAAQTVAITVNGPSAFTSASSTTFTVGSPGSFTVTAAGTPAPTITLTAGTLPAGVTFTSATGVLSGTPATGAGGVYGLTFTASNGAGPDSTQAFTLTVNEAPAITSGAMATFTIGVASSFPVTTTGFPAPSIVQGGAGLPSGVSFVDNGNGTGTLSGTPEPGTGGPYVLSFTATNTVGSTAPQTFTLTVSQPPTITSAATTTFTVGAPGSFTVTAAGSPAPAITVAGALPSGVTFTDNNNGTGTLSGTPAAGSGAAYPLTFTASNGVLPDATQPFTLTVNEAPAITSTPIVTFTVGTAGSFTVTTTGFPAAALTLGGVALPAGVSFVDNGNGTGTLSGTPGAGTGGTYAITFTATNTVGATAPQALTLTVSQPPTITSAASTSFTVGAAGSFTVTTTGFPTPAITRTGVVLPGGVTFTDNGDGTGTLSGTPAAGTAGAYAMTFTAANGALPDAVQAFTLAVQQPPAITSAASTTFTVGAPGTFTVTTTGFPTPTVSQTGTLPTGVTFTPATRVLGGTATQTGAFPLVFTATNSVSPDATQNFTLNVVCPAITVTPLVMPDGLYQTAYAGVDFNQAGSTGTTFTWGATGLPAGLTIDATTGVVSGTATNTVAAGAVVVTVTDNFGCQGTLNTNVTVRPTTDNENYTGGVGNTQYVTGAPFPLTPHVAFVDDVKTGDNGPGALSVAFPATSTNGGTILEGSGDGTFIYTPGVAFAGPTDTFTYTLTDGNGVTNTGTVTINLSNVVWYVNSAGGAGDGRSHSPFNTLNAAATPSGSTHIIYVHSGGATTTGNLAMDASQTVHGQGATFTLNGLTIGAGPRPTLTGTVTLADNTLVRAVNFAPAGIPAMSATNTLTAPVTIDQVTVTGGTTALSLTNVSGAVTVSNATFTNTTGAEVLINQGSGNVTVGATLSGNAGRLIDIQNRTGGSVTFTGPITDIGTGILLSNNGASTFSFSGGMTLNGTGTTFTATNASLAGSLTITGTNTIGATTPTSGTALNVSNINIGATGVTFRSIASNGATTGILLNNTGTGAVTVTGNSAGLCGGQVANSGATVTAPVAGDCTGGAILSSTGVGVSLTNTGAVSLTRVRIAAGADDAVRGSGVGGLTLSSSLIENNGNAVGERGIDITNLSGSGGIASSTIRGSSENNVTINNTSATLTSFNVTNSQIATNSIVTGDDGILLLTDGAGSITASITQSAFTDNKGDHFQAATTASATGAIDVTFSNNTLLTTTANDPNVIGGGITISPSGSADLAFTISNNNIQQAFDDAINLNLGTASTAAGSMVGTISNNTIGTAGDVDSGSESSNTITVTSNGAGSTTVSVTNNTIRQYGNGYGILIDNKEGSATVNATVTGNNIDNPGTFAINGIHVNAGATAGPPIDAGTTCAAITGNTVINAGLATADIRLRQRFNTTIRLPGYTGANNDSTAVNSFVSGNNGGAEVTSVNNVGGGGNGFVGGAACTLPQ